MNEKSIKATPESYYTSNLTPIVLEETKYKQVTFNGKQVDNKEELKKNIRGKLVIKKKTKAIEDFSQIEKFSRKDIKSNEYVEIDLDTEATYKLGEGLCNYYRLFSGRLTNPYEKVSYVVESDDIKRLKALIENDDSLASLLKELNTDVLNSALQINNLSNIQKEMQDNMDNDSETGFWQSFFEKNSWILSQLFHSPVMFFDGKRYVGGKRMDNNGGQITDFIYKNDITDNIAIIEIKTPVKKLVGSQYRQTYRMDQELNGAINQLLLQKESLYKSYHELNSTSKEHFNVCNIEAILVCGNVSELNDDERDAFERYRNELRSIRIIGFDELLMRIDNLINLFSNSNKSK